MQSFDIGYQSLLDGRGTEVYNRADLYKEGDERHYRTLAVVTEEGKINYSFDLPIEVKNEIETDVKTAYESFLKEKKEGEKFDFGQQFDKDLFRLHDIAIEDSVKIERSSVIEDTQKFDNEELTFQLSNNPKIIKDISPEILVRLEGNDIALILKTQPYLVDKLPLEKLDGNDISFVLGSQAHLADKLDLKKMDEFDIRHVLEMQPKLVAKLDADKLSGDSIAYILSYQPQLTDKLNLNKLSERDISIIVSNQPQLAKNLPNLKKAIEGVDGIGQELGKKASILTLKKEPTMEGGGKIASVLITQPTSIIPNNPKKSQLKH